MTWADVSKASRLLGYGPTTSLEEGLAKFRDVVPAAGSMSRRAEILSAFSSISKKMEDSVRALVLIKAEQRSIGDQP